MTLSFRAGEAGVTTDHLLWQSRFMRDVQELSFEPAGFETPVRHPGRALGKATECGVQERGVGLGSIAESVKCR